MTIATHDDAVPRVPALLSDVLAGEPAPQQSFPWKRERWKAVLHDVPEVLERFHELPDRVDRFNVSQRVATELSRGNILAAFVPVMVWGYGTTGYGPGRVRWVLTGVRGRGAIGAPILPSVVEKLGRAVDVARAHGNVAAYRYLYSDGRIKYLGGAFFTKWLYFATNDGDPDAAGAAPILDQVVARWLQSECGISLRTDTTDSYRAYNDLLSAWSRISGRSPAVIERSIFELDRAAPPRARRPRTP